MLRVKANVDTLQPWHDTELKAGNRWDKEIQTELEQMDIFSAWAGILPGRGQVKCWQGAPLGTDQTRAIRDRSNVQRAIRDAPLGTDQMLILRRQLSQAAHVD
jgi:hypothetical protein